MIHINRKTDALILVDAQPTFMPNGGLAVTDGDKIIDPILEVIPMFSRNLRVATKDRHPRGHVSLASSYSGLQPFHMLTTEEVETWTPQTHKIASHALFNLYQLKEYLRVVKFQVLWPDHAIDQTEEAEIHPSLRSKFDTVWVKGMDPACDSYSGFRDNLRRPTGLGEYLKSIGVQRVFIAGLALDYCVGFTGLNAVEYGFKTYVFQNASRSVAKDSEKERLRQLSLANVVLMTTQALPGTGIIR